MFEYHSKTSREQIIEKKQFYTDGSAFKQRSQNLAILYTEKSDIT